MVQIVLAQESNTFRGLVQDPKPKIVDTWSPKFEFWLHSPGSNRCEPCPWLFICKFFKQAANWST